MCNQPPLSQNTDLTRSTPTVTASTSPVHGLTEIEHTKETQVDNPVVPFDYDSIDICEPVLCAFSVEVEEGQSFEDVLFNSLYEDQPHQFNGYPSCIQDEYYMTEEEEFGLKSISEHGGEPVVFATNEFNHLPYTAPASPFSTFWWSMWSFLISTYNSWDLNSLYNCLSYELLTHFLVTLILSLFLTIGYLSNIGTIYLTLLFGVLAHLSINFIKTLWKDVKQIMPSRTHMKRKQLCPKPSRLEQWLADSCEKFKPQNSGICQFKQTISPRVAVQRVKPDGIASSNHRTRQLLVSDVNNTPGPRDARIKFIDSRAYLKVTLAGDIQIKALYDSGASSCSIKKSLLAKLDAISPVARFPYKYRIAGFIPGIASQGTEVVLLDFQLESGYTLRRVPMLIIDDTSPYDMIIGNNVTRAQKWNSFWKEDEFYIEMNHTGFKPVKASFLSNSSLDTVTIMAYELQPNQSVMAALEIPVLAGYKKTNFHNRELFLTDACDSSVKIQESITRIKNNKVTAILTNTQDHPIRIEENCVIGSLSIPPEEENGLTVNPSEAATIKREFDKLAIEEYYHCMCGIPGGLSEENFIVFTDQYGYTPFKHNLVLGTHGYCCKDNIPDPLTPLTPGVHLRVGEELTDLKKERMTAYLVPSPNNRFTSITTEVFNDTCDKLINLIQPECPLSKDYKTFYILIPSFLRLTLEMMKLMIMFSSALHATVIRISHSSFDHDSPYKECVNFGFSLPRALLHGVDNVKMHIQAGPFHPGKSSELTFRTEKTSIHQTVIRGVRLLFFTNHKTLIMHVHPPVIGHSLSKNFLERIFYSIFAELKMLRVPHEFQITTDINPHDSDSVENGDRTKDLISMVLSKMNPFGPPHPICFNKILTLPSIPVNLTDDNRICNCALCHDPTPSHQTYTPSLLYKDNINSLILAAKSLHLNDNNEDMAQASLNPMCLDDDELGFEIPSSEEDLLDPMDLVPESEMKKFVFHHPAVEDDVYSFASGSEVGVRNTFQADDWRKYFDITTVPEPARERFEKLMDTYKDVFACNSDDRRPILDGDKPAVLDFDLMTDKPIFIKPYPMNEKMTEIMDVKIDDFLRRGDIDTIDSPYNSPVLLVPHSSKDKTKIEGEKEYRCVLDLRNLNSAIKHKNLYSYLVKKVDDLFPRVQGCMYMTVLDLNKAYKNLSCSKRVMEYTAFRVPSSSKYGHLTFSFRSSIEGLAPTPGVYSYFLSKALSPRSKKCSILHIDDILVFSKDLETHLADLESVLNDLLKANFLVSISKMKAFQTQVTYLGHILDGQNLAIPPTRKNYFETMKAPTSKKELQGLLGIANYMSSFVDSFHIIVGPLYDALKNKTNNEKITLNEVQMKSFHQLKQAVVEAPKLHLVDYTKNVFMECDASLVAVGSIVYQEKEVEENGQMITKRVVLKFGSRKFNLTETLNSTSLEREGMAIIISIKQHWDLLMSCKSVIIKTDLKSLLSILACQNNPTSTKMARISHTLYSLNCNWSCLHVAGKLNNPADFLSRNYSCLYSDKLKFPKLDRDDVILPPEWENNPHLILTMKDLLKAMRDNILHIEKSSNKVKLKRLSALSKELEDRKNSVDYIDDVFLSQLKADANDIEVACLRDKQNKIGEAKISALRPISNRVLLTPTFIARAQQENKIFSNIIMHLKTKERSKISKKMLSKYRLLNDNLLVTRKDKGSPFDLSGNIRIVCDIKMALTILSYLHISTGHLGCNQLVKLFCMSYKVKNIYGLSRLVSTSCRACQLYRTSTRTNLPAQRIPYPPHANHTFSMDHMFLGQEITYKGKKVVAALNIVDNFSSLLLSFMVPDVKVKTTLACLKQAFSFLSPPKVMISDNASGLNANIEIAKFFRSYGTTFVTTTSPYNSKGNKTEIKNRVFRDVLNLTSETFKRPIPDIFHASILMVNSRPLNLNTHPHLKSLVDSDDQIITPYSLHYGLKEKQNNKLLEMEDSLTEEDRINYKRKWERLIAEHDAFLQNEIAEQNVKFKSNERLKVGDLCLYRNMTRNKDIPVYVRSVFEIMEIKRSKYILKPLFGYTQGNVTAYGNYIKPYSFSGLFDELPTDLRVLMGQCLDPEMLKERVTNGDTNIPLDFEQWGILKVPEKMQLRNKITPASLILSEPALSLSISSILTPVSENNSISTSRSSKGTHLSSQRNLLTTGSQILRTKEKLIASCKLRSASISGSLTTHHKGRDGSQNPSVTKTVTQVEIHQTPKQANLNKQIVPYYKMVWTPDLTFVLSTTTDSAKMDTPTNILAIEHDILSPETPNNPGLPLFASTEIKKSDSTLEGENTKLVFSDTKGLPIAVDNDQTAYRLSKGYLKDSSTRRHLPFDQTSDSNSKSSTSDNMPKRVPKSEKAYSDFMEKLQPSQRKAIELQPILKRLIDMSIADDDKPVDISSQSAPPTVIVASDQGVKPKKKKQPSQPQPEVSSRPQRTKKVPARYRD